jgi:hypothetical protein
MEDEGASASARVRAAECVLDRAHGKAAPVLEQPSDPDFVPLAERIKYYMRRDAIEAAEAEGEIVTAGPDDDAPRRSNRVQQYPRN